IFAPGARTGRWPLLLARGGHRTRRVSISEPAGQLRRAAPRKRSRIAVRGTAHGGSQERASPGSPAAGPRRFRLRTVHAPTPHHPPPPSPPPPPPPPRRQRGGRRRRHPPPPQRPSTSVHAWTTAHSSTRFWNGTGERSKQETSPR